MRRANSPWSPQGERATVPPRAVAAELAEINRLGLRFHEEQRFDKSLEQFWLGLLKARETGCRDWECIALNNIGMVYQSWGKFDHALKFYERSLEISQKVDFAQGAIATLNNLGRLYEYWGRLEKAKDCYSKGLAMAEAHGEMAAKRTTLLNLAVCLEREGLYSQCRGHLREVVRIDEIMNHPNTEVDKAYLAQLEDRP